VRRIQAFAEDVIARSAPRTQAASLSCPPLPSLPYQGLPSRGRILSIADVHRSTIPNSFSKSWISSLTVSGRALGCLDQGYPFSWSELTKSSLIRLFALDTNLSIPVTDTLDPRPACQSEKSKAALRKSRGLTAPALVVLKTPAEPSKGRHKLFA